MPPSEWQYSAQFGYFSHDDDPASWEFRATTLPGLGLLDKDFTSTSSSIESTRWERFQNQVHELNRQGSENKQYKVFYIIRHGEGVHNVKEKEVGRAEWNRYWAKQPGDGATIWEDAELVPQGEQQARELAAFWTRSFADDKMPPPQSIYSSPLRRCLRTASLAFEHLLRKPDSNKPTIKENLRERNGVHCCDKRSSKTWITSAYPSFRIEPGFTEEDELWVADRRETLEEHITRTKQLLDDIFDNDNSEFIALVAHSGASMALFAATGWKKVPVKAGAVYPLFVCREKV